MVRKLKDKNKTIEFNKTLTELKKNTKVSECLWGEECDAQIINAHSIQNNRFLNKISENGDIYSFKHGITESNKLIWELDKFGRKSFSTFKGFCKKHDKELFLLIEDVEYKGSKEQNFLFAFRALSKEYHAKKETVNFIKKSLDELEKNVPFGIEYIEQKSIFNKKLSIEETTLKIYENEFSKLKTQIKNNTYNGITTLTLELNEEYPIVCNSTFIPYKTVDMEEMYDKENYDKIQSGEINPAIFLNIFPLDGKTIILISYLEEYENYIAKYLKSFTKEENDSIELKHKISTMIIQHCENIGFSPKYIREKFEESELEKIMKVFSENLADFLFMSKTKINLFK